MPLFRRNSTGPDTDTDTGAGYEGPPPPSASPDAAPPDQDLRPSRMRGTESLYGYVVGLELLAMAIVQMVVRGGKGAPAHPQTTLQIVAVVVAVAFFGVLQVRNRTIVGFAAIIAAFFVTLPRVPNSLGGAHIFTLVIPLAYGLIISQRQRKAMVAAARGSRGGGGRGAGMSRREAARAEAGSRRAERRGRGKAATPQPTGPRPNGRYTPPKAKRATGKNKGKVAGG